MPEPTSTAIALLVTGGLLGLSALLSRTSVRVGLPFSLPASAAAGTTIADLPFPPSTSVLLVVRDGQIIAAKGATALHPGDHVHVLCDPAERSFVQLIFGTEETA